MNIQEELNNLHEIFSLFEDPKDKFVQLMDMAKESKGLSKTEKIDFNKINGCTSQAWLVGEVNGNDTYTFKVDSDALIVKGLLIILEKVFSNQPVHEILKITSNDILSSIGLENIITNQRTNGFASAVSKVHSLIK
tara:strand:+ start:272 stop:679 length:408 start_codon:yes stop_codon:yes gene_type:complete